jgi:tRNA(adenine34) deaminase
MKTAEIYESWVRRSIELTQAGGGTGATDVPVGALVLDRAGQLVAEGVNRREVDNDPTAHAEILALRAAAHAVGEWRLAGMTLVVSLEPCPMCAGAAVNARVARIVFGAWNPAYGACGSVWDLPRDRRLNHRPEVIGGVLAEEAGEVVSGFLAGRRD